jgi:hypothetical protein
MNVQLLPGALKETRVLLEAGYRGAGFLLGTAIGRFVLVERLLPLDFDPRQGRNDGVYAAVFRQFAEELLGVFFCRRRPLAADWLVGDLVLDLRPGRIAALTCEFSAAGRTAPKARLVPLTEDREGTWRI